jgi:hypothetical protein
MPAGFSAGIFFRIEPKKFPTLRSWLQTITARRDNSKKILLSFDNRHGQLLLWWGGREKNDGCHRPGPCTGNTAMNTGEKFAASFVENLRDFYP